MGNWKLNSSVTQRVPAIRAFPPHHTFFVGLMGRTYRSHWARPRSRASLHTYLDANARDLHINAMSSPCAERVFS
jgi:hypothetical protein